MATELYVMKASGAILVPADELTRETLTKWPAGQGLHIKVTRARNIRFHRKFFAMLNLAFDTWEPEKKLYHDEVAMKNLRIFDLPYHG